MIHHPTRGSMLFIIALLAFSFSSLKAETESSGPDISGAVWTSYEFMDRSANGAPESTGPGSEGTGFKMGRAYLNLQGTMPGSLKIKYRLTADMSRGADLADGCGTDNRCSEGNQYDIFMKYAYLDFGLPFNINLRIGQQPLPAAMGKESGSGMSKIWAHRYLDDDGKVPWHELGLTSTADIGIGVFHSSEYWGMHLVLSNGESYSRTNAERVSGANDTLTELANGSQNSYGYDFSGRLSVRPLGSSGDHKLHIMFPFRMHGVTGIEDTELRHLSADLTNPANVRWQFLYGDKRAWKDTSYGVETGFESKLGPVKWTILIGGVRHIDRRGFAYSQSENVSPYTLSDYNCQTGRICQLEDASGVAKFAFIHAKWREFGIVGRISVGNGSSSSVSSRLNSSASGDFVKLMIRKDLEDGQLGNLRLLEARQIDYGRSSFRKITLAFTWQVTDSFKVALGGSETTASDAEGLYQRENSLERIQGLAPVTSNVATQVETFLPTVDGSQVTVNDLIGEKTRDRSIFIRSEFKF